MSRVELVFAEPEQRGELARLVERMGHEVVSSSGPPHCFELLRDSKPQVLIGEESALLLQESLRMAPLLPVIVCLKVRDGEKARDFLKAGAFDCVAPPWSGEALGLPLRRALRVQGPGPWTQRFAWTLRRKASAFAVGVLVLACAFAAWRGHARNLRLAEERTFNRPLPYAHPSGAAWHDGLWAGDWYSQSLYRHGADLAVAAVAPLPGSAPVSFTFADGALYIASTTGRLVKRRLAEGYPKVEELRAPGPLTVGLCYDGLYLWSADAEDLKLRKHLLDDRLTVLETYKYPGGRPAAIACSGRDFWSLDEKSGQLLRHDLARPDLVLDREALPVYGVGLWKPAGLAFDGKDFWTVAEGRSGQGGRVFRHPNPWP